MFFGFTKKKQEILEQNFEGIKKETSLQAESLQNWLEDRIARESEKQSLERQQDREALTARIEELLKSQKRQSRSLEDFLDEEQERASAYDDMKEALQRGNEREAALLSLICCYQEQMHLLQQQVMSELEDDKDKKIAWKNQFEIVSDCIRREMRACAMEETGREGETVDFAVHEVLSASDTEDPMLESRVAKVFSPGCVYCGKTVKKARVAAYRRMEDGDDNRN